MLNKYRRHFITLNLSLVGTVLLATLLAVGIYTYNSYYRTLKTTMRAVLTPTKTALFMLQEWDWGEDILPIPRMTVRSDERVEQSSGTGRHSLRSLLDTENTRVCTVYYDMVDAEILVLSETDLLDRNTILSATLAASDAEESFGKLPALGLFYYREQGKWDSRIAFTPVDTLRRATMRLVLLLAGFFVLAMGIFYVISRYISGLAVKPLEEGMRRERQFVADVSHDLKTPLTVILANTAILQENTDSTVGDQLKWVDNTEDAAKNMQKLVNQMLTLSSLEDVSGTKAKAPETAINISDAVERAALQLESVAYDAGIAVETEVPEAILARANGEDLERIIASLIENALKYEPAGGTIYITLAEASGEAVLTVRNPGSVIPAEDLPHVFERFYRADKTRTAREGHGLGLAIAASAAQRMGGSLEVQSTPEQGTAFLLRLKQ